MEKYPVLRAITRYGAACAVSAGALVFIIMAVLLAPFGWIAGVIAAILGLVTLAIVKSYAELVALVTDILMPH